MIPQITLAVFLILNAARDLIHRKILLKSIPVFSLLGFLLIREKPVNLFLSILPGIFLLLLGKITKQAIGYGDGLVVLVVGIYLGLTETVYVVIAALFLSSFWGAFHMLRNKTNRKSELPWIPFLFAAVLWRWLSKS